MVPVWVTEMTWSDSWGIKESRMSGQRGSVKECLKLREKAVRPLVELDRIESHSLPEVVGKQ